MDQSSNTNDLGTQQPQPQPSATGVVSPAANAPPLTTSNTPDPFPSPSFASSLESKPLISLHWADVSVTAKLVSQGAPAGIVNERYAVYPQMDEKMPYRRGIKTMGIRAKMNANMPNKFHPGGGRLVPHGGSHHRRGIASVAPGPKQQLVSHLKQRQQNQGQGQGSTSMGQNGTGKAMKHCHICGRGFNKATYLVRRKIKHKHSVHDRETHAIVHFRNVTSRATAASNPTSARFAVGASSSTATLSAT